ncbi:UvrD-helicase domain-containing protein [Propioniciclava sp.]|uniref:UvrD-helicase domain-containing protein n=1 Tax=Propioniciclava sp. TaxID=2038686 RepID=UPI002606381F|nr:UvrD-helicase domain-containing protein [Propioniciclava sp.]
MTTTFDLTGPLPTGVTVLEASAGTGKTYAIAALAARFLAEGRAAMPELLLVTFSRAATAELRLRVRERLRSSAEALTAAAGGVPPADPVDAALAAAPAAEVAERAALLRRAFADFDRATIMTTHEFCQAMLVGLGVLAPQTPQSTLTEDLGWLADEAAADLYVQRYASTRQRPPFPFGAGRPSDDPGARQIARDAVADPASIAPLEGDVAVRERVAFAAGVREEVARRKADLRLYSFDDQLTRLDAALADPVTGPLARRRLADRFPIVLVDEFQDTDPVQWSVLAQAFAPTSTVVLIGDPKQAIYGFRGGDVHLYTRATRQAGALTTLRTNHRSDPGVVAGVATLFGGLALGEQIDVPDVVAAHAPRLRGEPGTPWERGVQIRTFEHDDAVSPWQANEEIATDLVGVVGGLLSDAAPLRPVAGGALRPRDVAVLVRSNRRGAALAEALTSAGIAATFSGTASVFASDAARDWLALLRALDRRRRPYLQRAWLTTFVGATLTELALADETRTAHWSLLVHTWARVLARGGVWPLLAAVEADTDLSARLLGHPGGERLVTDHRHLAEILHERTRGDVARPRELAAWLASEIALASGDAERTRRLETDADAVQIMTIHRAKGLQWPVVLLPEAGVVTRDPVDDGGRLIVPGETGRTIDVGGRAGEGRDGRWTTWLMEEGDEALRALYVGFTRAESHVVTWWSHHWRVAAAPLHRLLHAERDAAGPVRPALAYPSAGLESGGSPRAVAPLSGTEVAVAVLGAPDAPAPGRAQSIPPTLGVRPWNRTIDRVWRRTSYSGLTAAAHELAHAAPEAAFVADEPELDADVVATLAAEQSDAPSATPSPMDGLPAGPAFGSLVHAVYEYADTSGPDWLDRLAEATASGLARWPVAGVDAATLAAALVPSLETPLGPLAPGAVLRDFGPDHRLAELDFEFALTSPDATLADVAALLTAHLPPDDPLVDYPTRLAHPLLAPQRLLGFLTGSIDAVLKLDGVSPRRGYLVVDYKTNRLAPAGETLTVGHYTRAAMAEAMMAQHYPLQALLYCVALHRFLALRLAGYEPERDLAGVAYLFVRGMAGADTPLDGGAPLGVFTWQPPAALVLAVSRLLAGGEA